MVISIFELWVFVFGWIFGDLLRILYLKGPHIGSLWGGWENNSNETICAHITGTSSSYWINMESSLHCSEIIENRITAYQYAGAAFTYLCLVVFLLILTCLRAMPRHNVHNIIKVDK